MDPATLLSTMNGAIKLYGLVAEHREAQRWRDMTFSEAETVRKLCESGGFLVDVWPDRDGNAYVTVVDRSDSGRRSMGVAWDRWSEQRLSAWAPVVGRLTASGCAVDFMGLHGFMVTARLKQSAPGALGWAMSDCGHPASGFAPDGRCWGCEPQSSV